MDEKEKNLKGKYDRLIYYRNKETGEKIPRKRKRKGKDNQYHDEIYFETELDRILFTEEEVKSFSLDKHGQHIPYVDGELTILNNYLFDFWGWYLKAEGLALYGHLKRHAYGKKDWCFPNLELISLKMSKSVPTIRNYLEILERYGFIYKFGVYNQDNDGKEESPLYKIRKKIPFLTEKLLNGDPNIVIDSNLPKHIQEAQKKEKEGLPKRLFKEHEKYVAEMMANAEAVSIDIDLNFEDVYNELLKRGKRKARERSELDHSKETSIQNDLVKSEITEAEQMLWDSVLRFVETKVSKPSFDTWFKNSYAIVRKSNIYIISPNEFSRDWISHPDRGYVDLIKEALNIYKQDYNEIIFKCITESINYE